MNAVQVKHAAGLSMYAKFMLVVSGLVSLTIVGLWHANNIGIGKIFRDAYTMYAAIFMIAVFCLGMIRVHNVLWRLVRDHRAMDKLEACFRVNRSMKPRDFRDLVIGLCRDPRPIGAQSRVAKALMLLATRYEISVAHKVKTPTNRSVFHEDFEAQIEDDVSRIDALMVKFIMLGFFAFIAVLYVTFQNVPFPKTLEETAGYNRELLSGLGHTYLLTMIGLGSALITHMIKMYMCDTHKNEVIDRFRGVTFAYVFPVLHGALQDGYGDASEEKSHEAS